MRWHLVVQTAKHALSRPRVVVLNEVDFVTDRLVEGTPVIGAGERVVMRLIEKVAAASLQILVQQGDKVTKGMVVGLVGATGRATGPHLHFGIRINGARIDPMQFMTVNEAMERL